MLALIFIARRKTHPELAAFMSLKYLYITSCGLCLYLYTSYPV